MQARVKAVEWPAHPPNDTLQANINALLDAKRGVTEKELTNCVWNCAVCKRFFSALVFNDHSCQAPEVFEVTSGDEDMGGADGADESDEVEFVD